MYVKLPNIHIVAFEATITTVNEVDMSSASTTHPIFWATSEWAHRERIVLSSSEFSEGVFSFFTSRSLISTNVGFTSASHFWMAAASLSYGLAAAPFSFVRLLTCCDGRLQVHVWRHGILGQPSMADISNHHHLLISSLTVHKPYGHACVCILNTKASVERTTDVIKAPITYFLTLVRMSTGAFTLWYGWNVDPDLAAYSMLCLSYRCFRSTWYPEPSSNMVERTCPVGRNGEEDLMRAPHQVMPTHSKADMHASLSIEEKPKMKA